MRPMDMDFGPDGDALRHRVGKAASAATTPTRASTGSTTMERRPAAGRARLGRPRDSGPDAAHGEVHRRRLKRPGRHRGDVRLGLPRATAPSTQPKPNTSFIYTAAGAYTAKLTSPTKRSQTGVNNVADRGRQHASRSSRWSSPRTVKWPPSASSCPTRSPSPTPRTGRSTAPTSRSGYRSAMTSTRTGLTTWPAAREPSRRLSDAGHGPDENVFPVIEADLHGPGRAQGMPLTARAEASCSPGASRPNTSRPRDESPADVGGGRLPVCNRDHQRPQGAVRTSVGSRTATTSSFAPVNLKEITALRSAYRPAAPAARSRRARDAPDGPLAF